jgi:hypothetical protein
MIFNLECIICIRNYKDMIYIKFDYNLVYPIHNGSCHKQQMMRRFASFGTTHVIHCIITNVACLSGNKFTNWCPSSRRLFKSIKVIFHCSWAVHLERNISFKQSIHNCNCGFPWSKTSKSPHAFAMCSIRTDLLKQENEKIDSL